MIYLPKRHFDFLDSGSLRQEILRGYKLLTLFHFIIFCLFTRNGYSQNEIGVGGGGSFVFEHNTYSKKFINDYTQKEPRLHPCLQINFKHSFNKNLGVEINPSFTQSQNQTNLKLPSRTGAYRNLVVNHLIIPCLLSINLIKKERIQVNFSLGPFLDITPSYYLRTGYASLDSVFLLNSLENESYNNRKGIYIYEGGTLLSRISIAKDVSISKPLVKKYQYGLSGNINLDIAISKRMKLFFQISIHKSLNDFENKTIINRLEIDKVTGVETNITYNYYRNYYSKFLGVDIENGKTNPRATFLFFNSLLGIKYRIKQRTTELSRYN